MNRLSVLAAAAAVVVMNVSARAAVVVFGGPAYDAASESGYLDPNIVSVTAGTTAGNGTGVVSAVKYVANSSVGQRALRWSADNTPAVELDSLSFDINGFASAFAYGANLGGTVVGSAHQYAGSLDLGNRAVRWDAGGTAVTALGNLGTGGSGVTDSAAHVVNAGGTAVGYATKYTSGTSNGERAVRWNPGTTVATELGNLGTGNGSYTESMAFDVNDAGAAVGYALKYVGINSLGERAVRWDAGSTVATELGNLGTTSSGTTSNYAYSVNAGGTTVGYGNKYNAAGTYLGYRAIRWDAGSTVATELDNLGVDSNGLTASNAYAVNASGTVVGWANKLVGGNLAGSRAVRWNAGGTAITELGNLGTGSGGNTISYAVAINSGGIAVGYAMKYVAGSSVGQRAVAWGLDGVAIDLNTLIAIDSGWVLGRALSISDTNWVTGIGTYDPDGAGPAAAYSRAFLLQIPEPACLGMLAAACVTLVRRRRGF